jgi:5-methylcytosine-specific restriction endonuclease McrA
MVGINKLTIDHIFPVSKASQDYKITGRKRIYTINDVQPLCASCNKSKRDKIL